MSVATLARLGLEDELAAWHAQRFPADSIECKRPGCENQIPRSHSGGQQREYCSPACRNLVKAEAERVRRANQVIPRARPGEASYRLKVIDPERYAASVALFDGPDVSEDTSDVAAGRIARHYQRALSAAKSGNTGVIEVALERVINRRLPVTPSYAPRGYRGAAA